MVAESFHKLGCKDVVGFLFIIAVFFRMVSVNSDRATLGFNSHSHVNGLILLNTVSVEGALSVLLLYGRRNCWKTMMMKLMFICMYVCVCVYIYIYIWR
jgi:small-conductance mechanosensitive channel